LNLGNRRLNKTTIILFERNKLHTIDEEEFRGCNPIESEALLLNDDDMSEISRG
jgi:hypothetical protein